jgi:hypothetical protein
LIFAELFHLRLKLLKTVINRQKNVFILSKAKVKASINFQIKQWAECRAEGTLPLMELSKRLAYGKYGTSFTDFHVLEWVNGEPVYFDDIESQFNLPGWVLKAVENQAISIRKNKFTSH